MASSRGKLQYCCQLGKNSAHAAFDGIPWEMDKSLGRSQKGGPCDVAAESLEIAAPKGLLFGIHVTSHFGQ